MTLLFDPSPRPLQGPLKTLQTSIPSIQSCEPISAFSLRIRPANCPIDSESSLLKFNHQPASLKLFTVVSMAFKAIDFRPTQLIIRRKFVSKVESETARRELIFLRDNITSVSCNSSLKQDRKFLIIFVSSVCAARRNKIN